MKCLVVVASALVFVESCSSYAKDKRINVSRDIYIVRMTDNTHVHVSYSDMPPFGRAGSDGLIFINDRKAFLFDTPMTEPLTRTLVSWIQDTIGLKIDSNCPGNTADGDLTQYGKTIEIVLKKYGSARFVMPGHGQFGGSELLRRTRALADDY